MPTDVRELFRELRDAPVTTHTAKPVLRRLRRVLCGAWLMALVLWTLVVGPPLSLRDVLVWLSLAMLVASVGNPLGWAKSMLLDWCPLYMLLVGYNIAHGLVDNLGVRPHVDPHLSFDQALFGESGPTDLLQAWLWAGGPSWYDDVFFVVYLSHFVVTLVVCAMLWMRAREGFLAYRRRVVSTWLLALMFFAAYPSVPPWMAADQGHLPEMTRIVASLMGVASNQAGAVLGEGDGRISLANPVAAVPSMHAALPMVLLLFLWHRARWLRIVLASYTLIMGFVLVYGGEHYVFDILAGWACAAAIHCGWSATERRRAQRDLPRQRISELTEAGPVRDAVGISTIGATSR